MGSPVEAVLLWSCKAEARKNLMFGNISSQALFLVKIKKSSSSVMKLLQLTSAWGCSSVTDP